MGQLPSDSESGDLIRVVMPSGEERYFIVTSRETKEDETIVIKVIGDPENTPKGAP